MLTKYEIGRSYYGPKIEQITTKFCYKRGICLVYNSKGKELSDLQIIKPTEK